VLGICLASVLGGCSANEHVIPRTELMRLAELPPEVRGRRVHVVQELVDRRSKARVALSSLALLGTEGVRYDGDVVMDRRQTVYLADARGLEREVALAGLRPEDAAAAAKAYVMEDEGQDEGQGMLRLGRRPLDRKGLTLKLDVGGFYGWNGSPTHGPALDVQLGVFPHHRVGLLLGWAFSTGSDFNHETVTRNVLSLEAQVFPVGLWRIHPGLFAQAGLASGEARGESFGGNAFGGGLIVELALTTRLALTLRAGHTLAQYANDEEGWASVSTFSGGVAIY
jgi:hypothetical protein